MQSWTGSVDFGGFWAPAAVTARGTFSVAVDHQGGVAVILSGGGGGSTPTTNIGVGVTGTNAPNVSTLTGYSVQSGGSIKSPTGQGVMAEGVVFTDKGSGQTYVGLSVSGVGSFPDPLIASVHGTFEYSWIPEIGGIKLQGNVIDWFFAPIEWVLQD